MKLCKCGQPSDGWPGDKAGDELCQMCWERHIFDPDDEERSDAEQCSMRQQLIRARETIAHVRGSEIPGREPKEKILREIDAALEGKTLPMKESA